MVVSTPPFVQEGARLLIGHGADPEVASKLGDGLNAYRYAGKFDNGAMTEVLSE